ncbi:hypothetical protein [Streptosporangium sp. V21-05]|uniref:hypothetical protein n=1 Tax=Streptosporangium sp. V21-05 TaxID=3446115 RepID=UPI003F53B835
MSETTWNFPFDLPVGPLVEMLAAGDRVTAGERPLALCVFAKDKVVATDVPRRTTSVRPPVGRA